MLKILSARFRQGYRTMAYPDEEPVMPERYRGRLAFPQGQCPSSCQACTEVCPTTAITKQDRGITADMGRCLFCGECVRACPEGIMTHLRDYRLASNTREGLITDGSDEFRPAHALEEKTRKLFGRSLHLRQVSAGGCNACEADTNVLGTVGFDLGRFGIRFVASPRHADGLLITGPVTENMELALRKTYDAVPSPKIVIPVGACAISGGPFADHPEVRNGAGRMLPIDLHVPGCPPHPMTILDGLLRLLGRIG